MACTANHGLLLPEQVWINNARGPIPLYSWHRYVSQLHLWPGYMRSSFDLRTTSLPAIRQSNRRLPPIFTAPCHFGMQTNYPNRSRCENGKLLNRPA
jgi:hypothetical protein